MSWRKTILTYKSQLLDGQFDEQLSSLMSKLVEQPNNPKEWLGFLNHATGLKNEALDVKTTLKQLHVHAWSLTKGTDKGGLLWELGIQIGKYYWKEQLASGRRHFRMLEGIGGKEYAPLYIAWAGLEHSSGNTPEALKILSKGLDRGVQPQQPLEDLRQSLETNAARTMVVEQIIKTSIKEREPDSGPGDQIKEDLEPSCSLQHNGSEQPRNASSLNGAQEGTTGMVSSTTQFGPPHRVERNSSCSSSSDSSSMAPGSSKKRQKLEPATTKSCIEGTQSQDCRLPCKVTSDSGDLFNATDSYGAPDATDSGRMVPESISKYLPHERLPSIMEEPCASHEARDGTILGSQTFIMPSQTNDKTGRYTVSTKITAQSRSSSREALWQKARMAIEGSADCGALESIENEVSPAESSRHVVERGLPYETSEYVYVRGNCYTILKCIGKGGSSKVFQVSSFSSVPHGRENRRECSTFAMKRCEFKNCTLDVVEGYKREVELLLELRGEPGIVRLIDWQIWEEPGVLFIVMEHGETTLDKLLERHGRRQEQWGCSSPDWCFIGFKWKEMLHAVRVIHEHRVVHSDLKPANFLMVKGELKLIDFGIAGKLTKDATSILRETMIGSVSYMAPETLRIKSSSLRKAGVAQAVSQPSDIWSLGVILFQIVHGKLPFTGSTHQMIADIVNENHDIYFPEIDNEDCTDVLRQCLTRDPSKRITMKELLNHRFMHREQLAQKDSMPSPMGKGMLQRALQQTLPDDADAKLVSAKLYDLLKDNLIVRKPRRKLKGEDAETETRTSTGLPEGTHTHSDSASGSFEVLKSSKRQFRQ